MRIGRYEVLGRLASGGMAEILLGRLQGPYGFERPVVIKRILPHLSDHAGFVDMFLDEARIIANLHHPNLIHVHELGRDGDELFIAMEYLEGETLSGLCRRLAARGEQADFSLAAHVVAEACAGLHAAHEATGTDGRPLCIVHRDVTPQNVFVGYAGHVRVIDFGIARAEGRTSRTESGTVKGKFEYLAPEQLRNGPIDRRVDIFALGVVLFELASGRRLYKREGHAATIHAILSDPPPCLSEFREDAPPALEAICLRALAKAPSDRFQTAAQMRRELLSFVRRHRDDDPSSSLAELMGRLFTERREEKAAMLRTVEGGSTAVTMPSADVDVDVELPTCAEQAPTVFSQVAPARDVGRSGSGRRWLLLAPALALVAVAAVVGRRELSAASARGPATVAAASALSAPSADLPASASVAPSTSPIDEPRSSATASATLPPRRRPPAPAPARHRAAVAASPTTAPPAPTSAPTLW